ncbi:hypothetical protein H2202_002382 [Exophiala xenobiotica]|nr:hypothetical protein H2202_002382 [Exophiala xenobiotica]KAK5247990.1 hypothetical protein LTR40_011801 [Exophiala xenobiotica]
MIIARRFSVTNFLIATSALTFQVFVLYPWHSKLDEDFQELKQENMRLMQEIQRGRIQDLKEIKETFSKLRAN